VRKRPRVIDKKTTPSTHSAEGVVAAFLSLFQPGLDDLFAGMDAELTEWGCACVGELVGSFGRDDDDVAARGGQCFCADNKRDHTFLDDKNFFVGMGMERGTQCTVS
jgi:hypothetical protein